MSSDEFYARQDVIVFARRQAVKHAGDLMMLAAWEGHNESTLHDELDRLTKALQSTWDRLDALEKREAERVEKAKTVKP